MKDGRIYTANGRYEIAPQKWTDYKLPNEVIMTIIDAIEDEEIEANPVAMTPRVR